MAMMMGLGAGSFFPSGTRSKASRAPVAPLDKKTRKVSYASTLQTHFDAKRFAERKAKAKRKAVTAAGRVWLA